MACILLPCLATLLALALFLKLLLKFKNISSKPHPPGPPGWPLVGNIFDLGEVPHQTLHKLQARYGPVIRLKLGTINTIVVQSSEVAAELFKKHDLTFASRKVLDSMTALGYNRGSLAFAAYGEYWRKVRRICTVEFLVMKRLNESIPIRRRCVDGLVDRINSVVERSEDPIIELNSFLFLAAFNAVGNILLSEEVMRTKLDEKGEFFEAFLKFVECLGKPNVVDCFPFLKWLDPQGIRRNTGKYLERWIRFASGIVSDRIRERESGVGMKKNDFLDALLDEGEVNQDGPDKLSLKNITIVLLEMFLGGTETTGTTIEWGMAELLRHPSSMEKIQEEIDRVVGRTRRVEEDDLTQMPYLQATVKEILRLHPSVQMLLPRNSMEDTELMDYFVPKDTQLLVNAWAIHRDPTVWPDPLSFKPERFLDADVDFRGQHFHLIPFGSGRRSCVGVNLGHRMVGLTLASLLQVFDWKLAGGLEPEELDMREMVGLTLRRKVPLKVIPCLRE
ncbi:cytochrome P450- family 76- subfamily G-polypeptide 1 [Striga hermonthica]|uniref:Flavonoid-6-hydroxylase n=1 Tax=Striga hermonthica TaxID=68872 RepID=A0A9N7NAS1_STRHE|nr:cytochrome P450- family 76- subfamily G-polypeptide 1 [Striga hermonthica]